MFRSTRLDNIGRAVLQIARATIKKPNDKPKVQELDLELAHDEEKVQVENFGQYGFKSVPLSPKDGKKAEAIVAFLGGNRSHGVVIAVDDRRHRPRDWKEGESGLYDDQGQLAHLQRDGVLIKSPKKITLECGSSKIVLEPGKVTITGADIEFVKA